MKKIALLFLIAPGWIFGQTIANDSPLVHYLRTNESNGFSQSILLDQMRHPARYHTPYFYSPNLVDTTRDTTKENSSVFGDVIYDSLNVDNLTYSGGTSRKIPIWSFHPIDTGKVQINIPPVKVFYLEGWRKKLYLKLWFSASKYRDELDMYKKPLANNGENIFVRRHPGERTLGGVVFNKVTSGQAKEPGGDFVLVGIISN